jgi:hypothetical protein
LKTLVSISEISREQIIETSRNPIRVEANDLNTYLCKHVKEPIANILFNEFIAHFFLQTWNIIVPDAVFIEVKREHIMNEILSGLIQYENFKKTCIGFEYLTYAQNLSEIDLGINKNRLGKQNLINKEDLLRILLFDIWVSNEDRNSNNYNLLLNPEKEGNRIIPIDHEFIFNSNSLERGVYQINDYDSLVTTSLFKSLFPKQNKKKIVILADQIIEEFFNYVKDCSHTIDNVFQQVPNEWNIDKQLKDKKLKQIFTDLWLKETVKTFKLFIERNIK